MNAAKVLSLLICQVAVVLLLWLSGVLALQAWARSPRRTVVVAFRLTVPPFLVALAMRLLAPWGPHINSGRDLRYIDAVIDGGSDAHTHLMAVSYRFVRGLADPLAGVIWGQLIVGALCTSLLALLVYGLCRRELPAFFAGLMAALLVVLIRVDASPNAMVTFRFYLLLTLLAALAYLRRRSLVALVATGCGLVALSYGRLESPLVAGLVLVWLAVSCPAGEPSTAATTPLRWSSLRALGGLLALIMFASLLHRLLLIPAVVLVALWLFRRNGRRLAALPVVTLGLCVAVALMPRAIEIFSLERVTHTRFPFSLLLLFGKTNLLLFDPALCASFVVLLVVLGIWRARRAQGEADTAGYLVCVALPVFVLYLLFMGNASARVKLQGAAIMLLLPAAGLGAEQLVGWLSRWRDRPTLWASGLGMVLTGGSLLLGARAVRSATSLQQEFAFLKSLPAAVPEGSVVYALPREEKDTRITVPRFIQSRGGFTVRPLDPNRLSAIEPGALVLLTAACRRFRGGEALPGVGQSLSARWLSFTRWPAWQRFARFVMDKDGTYQQVFDTLPVTERPICASLRARLGLEPHLIIPITRSPLDGNWMVARFSIGLYRATRTAASSSTRGKR